MKYPEDNEEIVVQNVPIEGIDLMDDLLTQDWHLEGAFRHEIMIPDDLFPELWKNKVKQKKKKKKNNKVKKAAIVVVRMMMMMQQTSCKKKYML